MEKSLVPQLKTALETRDAESTVKLYNVYSTIQKRARFEACLFEAQAGTLLESWTDFNVDTSVQIALSKHLDPAGVFIDWLSKFLISLHSLFVTEWEWIGPLLPDAQSLILGLINYTFTQLDPRLKSRLDTFLRVLGPSSFPVISTAYKVTVEFGHRVEKSLSAVIFNGLNHSSGSDQQDDEPGVWGLPVFEEFVPFQVDYGVYERTALLQVLASVLEDSRKSTNHMVRVLFYVAMIRMEY